MTEHEIMKAKYANTAFAILFEDRHAPVDPLTAKEIARKARIKANNDRYNAMRAANNIKADNKRKANWTI